MSWTKPPFCFMMSRLTGVHSKNNFRTSIKPGLSALLFNTLPFHCDNTLFVTFKAWHPIRIIRLGKTSCERQTLSRAEKLIETMKERMKEDSIGSAEQAFVVLKEIKHNLVMCSLSLCTSPESTFTQHGGGPREHSQSALLAWRWKRLRSS